MSNRLHANDSIDLVIAASDKLAIFSRSPVKVYHCYNNPNMPILWTLLTNINADTEYLSSAFSAETHIRIDAGAADVLYALGTAPVITERRDIRGQGDPIALNTTGTLTAAMIASGIVTSTTAAAVTATLNTGTIMDAALYMAINESFDWTVINTGSTNAFIVTAAASGHTIVGSGAVAALTSATFRTRKTAANTFITYRL